jgi:sulfite exporter TauE/SafE
MCGPIVVSFSLHLKDRSVIVPHLFYNVGRILTYTVLGGILGITGSFTGFISNIVTLQKGVMIFTGLIIVIMGLAMSGWIPLKNIFGDYRPEGLISKWFRRLSTHKSSVIYLPLGLLLGLLPCGPVYTALIAAARVGMEGAGPWQGLFAGMGLMFSFGLGTIPSLLIVGRLTGFDWFRSRQVIIKVSSLLMVFVGIYFVVRGVRY